MAVKKVNYKVAFGEVVIAFVEVWTARSVRIIY